MARSGGLRQAVSFVVGSTAILIVDDAQAARRPHVADHGRSSCLVLEWMDPHELVPAGERWMAKETTRILGEARIAARWDWSRDGERASSAPTREHRLRVVLLPSEPSGPGWGLGKNTLGTTLINGVSAPPAVYIFYRSVVSLLSRDGRSHSWSDPYAVGPASRAFGRVVAHEVAHALAPAEPHARSGLMQAGLAVALLTDRNDVAFDERWKRALSAGLSELCSVR
jgi:hypothetical protein